MDMTANTLDGMTQGDLPGKTLFGRPFKPLAVGMIIACIGLVIGSLNRSAALNAPVTHYIALLS